MAECFNCGADGVELRREPNATDNAIGEGCPLCRACWDAMIGHRTDWDNGIRASVVIDHERYGERQEFASVEDAQQAIRDCGPEFVGERIYEDGGRVYNARGERVGSAS